MDLLDRPAPSFDDPVGLLLACHRRIEKHCDTLQRMPKHLEKHGVDSDLQTAITRILRYFSLAGPAHHADEELGLFPWLLARPDFPGALRAPLRNLVDQHRQLETAWQNLSEDLNDLIVTEKPRALRLEPFVIMNRAHIALEDGEIFPLARQILDPDSANALGRTMILRRREEDGSS
jgi:hemerythrin-like domain-containing protein